MFTTPADRERADYPLMCNGAVNLYWRGHLFRAAMGDLQGLGYRVVRIAFANIDRFVLEMTDGLLWDRLFNFRPWNGNLNALADAFNGMDLFDDDLQVAFCIERFHGFVAKDADYAHGVLEVLDAAAREQLLLGRRIVVLIQTDDPNYHTGNLAMTQAKWNDAEWLTASRGAS